MHDRKSGVCLLFTQKTKFDLQKFLNGQLEMYAQREPRAGSGSAGPLWGARLTGRWGMLGSGCRHWALTLHLE